MCARKRIIALVGVVCLLGFTQAYATPVVGIHTEQEWRNALLSNQIVPVPGTVFESMVANDDQWPDDYKNAEFVTPVLDVFADLDGEAGLYMAWGPASTSGQRIAAAWDYVYTEDPDLNGTSIDFSIFPPVYCTYLSLNLIDKFGNYREWIWHAGDPGEVPWGQWSTLSINPVTGWSNWPTVQGSPFIHNVPGFSFDLSSIQILRFNENISATPGFPPGPFGNVPNGWVWNAWNHFDVTPEPSMIVMLLGLVGMGAVGYAWRRRRSH